MSNKRKYAFNVHDCTLWESPDFMWRDIFAISEETCGAQEVSAGILWLQPGGEAHTGLHPDWEEFFYIIQAKDCYIEKDGEPIPVETGDMFFVPRGVAHKPVNRGDDFYIAVWAIMAKSSDIPDLAEIARTWHPVEPDSPWKPPKK